MTARPALPRTSSGVPPCPGPPRPVRPDWWPSPAPATPPFHPPARYWPDPAPGPDTAQPASAWADPQRGPAIFERLMERRIVMAHGHLGDDEATRLCAQLLTLDAEGDDPIRFELQNLDADLPAALTIMGVLDVVGVTVRARAAGQITGAAALGVLAACGERDAYPNAMFALSEPMMKFDGTPVAIAAREEQTRRMLDSLYFRLAEVTGREVDEIRDGARARRVLTVAEAQGYGLVTGRIERRRRV
jgi:ATP-dependent Clp protease, protease subunit